MHPCTSNGLGLVGLSHVSLSTRNLAAAEYFYLEILGGVKVFDLINPSTKLRYGTFLSMGNGTFVELFTQTELPRQLSVEMSSIYRHICLQVRSVTEAAGWLGKFGYEAKIKIGRTDRVPQFFITGPDGVELEFHEYCEGSPQREFVQHGG